MKNLLLAISSCLILLSGCALDSQQSSTKPEVTTKESAEAGSDGKYYKDDGPPSEDEVDWRAVVDPVPEFVVIPRRGNAPYEVFGVRYVPFRDYTPYRQQGIASWYGKRYHGRLTSSGEVYDMFAMSAAHPVLPIPSYAKVTRVDDGRSVIVRVNDRGPFLQERIIDLSYTAARKLGVVATGTAEVLVEALLPSKPPTPSTQEVKQQKTSPAKPAVELARDPALQKVQGHFLQLGAFAELDNARKLREISEIPVQLQNQELAVKIIGKLYKVLLGPYVSEAAALEDLSHLRRVGLEAIPINIK